MKIGAVRFQARCARHPGYDPNEGEGAIRGGCKRCAQLLEIWEAHRRLTRLIGEYGPRRLAPAAKEDGRQQWLF